jgi:hypothetical protein
MGPGARVGLNHASNESAEEPPARAPLRVALLIDSFTQPRWVHDVIRDIERSDVARVVLVVKQEEDAAAEPPRRGGRLGIYYRNRRGLLYSLYEKLDGRKFRAEPDPFDPADVAPLLAGRPVIPVKPRMTKFCDYFDDADVEAILAHDVDVAVRFGFRILKGRSLEIAKHGVWSYHHGSDLTNRGGPAGFWETMEGQPVTGSILQVLNEELDNGRVLYRSYSSTNTFSVRKNKTNYYWKSSAFLLRKLRDLYCFGPEGLQEKSLAREPWSAYSSRLYTKPGNAEMARLLARLAGRFAANKVRTALGYEQWFLAYTIGGAGGGVPNGTLYRAKPLVPPGDRIWADPFPVKQDGRYFIFFEEMKYENGKGYIAVAEVDKSGLRGEPRRVLERDYHLSYPFMFEWRGTHYMIPETETNGTVELYRATAFPYEWELDRVLLSDIRAVDSTVAEIGGRWWMFTTMAVPGALQWDELHLFHADSPLGPWTPHRRNPVKSDVRSARPAGRLFTWRGELYRPAQDCSARYGYAITINRVDRIDPDGYEEVEVSKILPTWMPGIRATHTINAADDLTVVDAIAWRPKLGRG